MIFAISQISQQTMYELVIICEDSTAKSIIEKTIGNNKKRVSCIDMGCKSELLKAAHFNILSKDRRKFLVIWDGDVSDADIDSYFQSIGKDKDYISYLRLPSNLPPEKWILSVIDNEKGYEMLANNLCSDIDDIKESIEKAKTIPNHHYIFYRIAENLGSNEAEVAQELCKAAFVLAKDNLVYIKDKVIELLEQ